MAVFSRWATVVGGLIIFDNIGEQVLAIRSAVESSGVFILVLLLLYCGFVHACVALNIVGWERSFLYVFRLAFIADLEPKVWNEEDVMGPMFWCTQILMIVMMNLFVGVLFQGYRDAYVVRQRTYQQVRARIAFYHYVRKFAPWKQMWKQSSGTAQPEPKYLWYCQRVKTSSTLEDGR